MTSVTQENVFTCITSAENDPTLQNNSSPAVVTVVKSGHIFRLFSLVYWLFFFSPGLFFVDPLFSNISFFLQLTSLSKHGFLNRTGESFDSELYNRIGVAGCLGDAYGLQATVTGAQTTLTCS